MRNLVLALGDQLDANAAAFDGFDPETDVVWMAEVVEESEHVWSSNPRIALFLAAHAQQRAPLAAVEGFIRQILGWREYVRGIYWLHMPDYLERNALDAHEPLPAFYWNGDTLMNCLREAISQTLQACPFTTLYWDFLLRNESRLRGNQRMALQLRNLVRLQPAERETIRAQAAVIRRNQGQP